jgi:hypothetical protein
MRRYFLGDGDTGTHLLLFGDAGLIRGSKSRLLFRVAPHAIGQTTGEKTLPGRSRWLGGYVFVM